MSRKIRQPPCPLTLPSGGCAGLDPGKDGTIGYAWGPGQGEFWRLDQMTDQETWQVIEKLGRRATGAVLERVGAMRKGKEGKTQGTSSAFVFGKGAGKLEAWLVASGLRWELVPPAKWQAGLGCRTAGDKRVTQAAAERLWPGLKFGLKTSEGLLIAEWGRLYSPLMVETEQVRPASLSVIGA